MHKLAVVLALLLTGCPTPAKVETLPLVPVREAETLPLPAADATRWLGPPMSPASARGKVVLLEVWTFACEHCRASHPWVAAMAARKDLVVISVHSPQTSRERDPARVAEVMKQRQISWPVYIDADVRYFEQVRAEGWPTFLLIDRAGRLRARTLGRAEPASPHARGIEAALRALLSEPSLAQQGPGRAGARPLRATCNRSSSDRRAARSSTCAAARSPPRPSRR